jgi:hypothetical protein
VKQDKNLHVQYNMRNELSLKAETCLRFVHMQSRLRFCGGGEIIFSTRKSTQARMLGKRNLIGKFICSISAGKSCEDIFLEK